MRRLAEDGAVQQLQEVRQGRLTRITFDEAGNMSRDAEQSDVAAPPLQSDTSYRRALP